MPVGSYQTYQILAPRSTHFRPATCEEVQCEHFLKGWRVAVPVGGRDEGIVQHFVREKHSVVRTRVEGGMTVFEFQPGNVCFKSDTHKVRLERDPHYFKRRGDHRVRFDPTRATRLSGQAWVEDFAENQDKLKTAIERG